MSKEAKFMIYCIETYKSEKGLIGVSIVLTNIQESCLMPVADSIKEEKIHK